MLASSSSSAKTFALGILLLIFFSAACAAEARCPFAGMTLPDPEVLQAHAASRHLLAAAQAVDASASDDGTTVVATGSQAGVGTFGDFFKTPPGRSRPRHLNFTVSLMGSVADVGANDEQYIAVPLPEAEALKAPRLKTQPIQFGYKAPQFSKPSSCSDKTFMDIVKAINASVVAGDLAIPGLGRLGFHNCGTFSAIGYQGGCDGAWMRFAPDMNVPQNGGTIKAAREGLDKLRNGTKGFDCITHADLYTLAAAVATELAGGPAVGWSPGRVDAMGPGPAHPPLSSALPDGMMTGAADAAFFTRWGFTVREAVAILGGGHSFGGADTAVSGWSMSFTTAGDNFPEPKNQYFIDLMKGSWVEALAPQTGLPQWNLLNPNATDGSVVMDTEANKPVGRLPSDIALRVTRLYAEVADKYAADEKLFLDDFALTFEKLLSLGASGVGVQGGNWRWKGFNGTWEGYGKDAAIKQLK